MNRILQALGRGRRYPFFIEDGGVGPDLPDDPTPEDVRQAVIMAVRFVARIAVGSLFFARTTGTVLDDAVFSPNDAASRDVLAQSVKAELDQNVAWFRVKSIQAFAPDKGTVFLRMGYLVSKGTSERSIDVPFPRAWFSSSAGAA